jgi:hypothetical protein
MRRTFAGAALAAVAALVVGCSDASPTGHQQPTATSTADMLAVWRDFAACARTHGVPDLPDPTIGPDGKVVFPGFENRSAPDSVRAGCQQILDRLPADGRPSAAPTDIPALLRFAACMRVHGFPDWPDPQANGTFPAGQLPNKKTPALISAMQACDSLNPDRGGHVYAS